MQVWRCTIQWNLPQECRMRRCNAHARNWRGSRRYIPFEWGNMGGLAMKSVKSPAFPSRPEHPQNVRVFLTSAPMSEHNMKTSNEFMEIIMKWSTFIKIFLDSSISKVMSAGLNDRDSIPNRVGDSSPFHNVQSVFGAHPNSYSTCTESCRGLKRPENEANRLAFLLQMLMCGVLNPVSRLLCALMPKHMHDFIWNV
jgi:hypothetical protein